MRFEPRMDVGLAKSAPDTNNLSSETYRTFRRRLDIFERLCKRRSDEVVSEGALLVMQTLTGEAWDACESCNLDVPSSPNAFDELRKALDKLYLYTPEIALRSCCGQFFTEFARQSEKTLNAY